MTSPMMTLLASIGAMISFALSQLPADTNVWVKLLLGTLGAGISFYLGYTNKGTAIDRETAIEKPQPHVHLEKPPTLYHPQEIDRAE
jgi:hypothetical protein